MWARRKSQKESNDIFADDNRSDQRDGLVYIFSMIDAYFLITSLRFSFKVAVKVPFSTEKSSGKIVKS